MEEIRTFTRDCCGFWHQLFKSGNGETWPDSSSWEAGLGLLVGHKLNLSQMYAAAKEVIVGCVSRGRRGWVRGRYEAARQAEENTV